MPGFEAMEMLGSKWLAHVCTYRILDKVLLLPGQCGETECKSSSDRSKEKKAGHCPKFEE